MEKETVFRVFKMSISKENMSNVFYAIIITKAKLKTAFHLGLEKYTRRQNAGNIVDIVIEIEKEKLQKFECLSRYKPKELDVFQ
jgi:hypothetical protein